MSNLIVPDTAKKNILTIFSGGITGVMKLFQNNITPAHNTVYADFTEATFSGYASQSLSGASVAGSLDSSGRGVVTWTALTWTKSGATGNTIYGYWVENSSGVLLWCERFDSPIVMTADGAFLTLTPKLTDMSQFSNT
jgi:hypothetical protein